ncbi:YaiI/YqxD family protein [Tepidibacillus marianensis]|uniref:YaiI/YqxD family protein n=1 Tax=Tepidibacillus marianensis TaxID=3131995 RepID=UPI0030CE554F
MIKMRLLVDADACPVKNEIIQLGQEFSIPVVFVLSFAHFHQTDKRKDVTVIYVDQSSQSVDIHLANMIQAGDIVFTNDYGLASMLIRPKVIVFSFRGQRYTAENMDQLLEQRHFSFRVRRGGGKTKGPKAFSILDRKKFVESVRKSLIFLQENA